MFTGENLPIVTLIAGFVLSALLFVYIYKKRNDSYRQCLKKLEALEESQELELARCKLATEERILSSIARELHDNFNMQLIVASMNLKHIDWNKPAQIKPKINNCIEQLNEAIQGLTDLSRSLNTDYIKSLGLIGAIEKELERIRNTNSFQVELEIRGEPVFLPDEMELTIFRIIQEAFNNIIKHARTHHVQLTLTYLAQQMFLVIVDNGVGFHATVPQENEKGNGSGLHNMRSRIRTLQGELRIRSVVNGGTSLIFQIPYPPTNSVT